MEAHKYYVRSRDNNIVSSVLGVFQCLLAVGLCVQYIQWNLNTLVPAVSVLILIERFPLWFVLAVWFGFLKIEVFFVLGREYREFIKRGSTV